MSARVQKSLVVALIVGLMLVLELSACGVLPRELISPSGSCPAVGGHGDPAGHQGDC